MAHLNAQVHELPWFPAEKSTNLRLMHTKYKLLL